MSVLIVKAGQTFVFHATFYEHDGTPTDLSNYRISSQIRDALGNAVATLASRLPVGRPGTVNLWNEDGTTDWPIGRLFCDLHFVRPDGVVQFTETFSIIVAAPITRPGVTP